MKYREEEDLRMFEHSLNEKQYATERMMDECAKLSVEVERLVENQIVRYQFLGLMHQMLISDPPQRNRLLPQIDGKR